MALTCATCGNATLPKVVHVTMWHGGRLVVIENVPAQICEACQEQFYDEGTQAEIMRLVENAFPKRRIVREMTVPVYSLKEPAQDAAPETGELVKTGR